MFSSDRWQEIFQSINKNRLRTFLSGFTVALGILIFVILFGLGNGLKNTFQEFFMDNATNVFFVFPGRTSLPYRGYKSNRQIEFTNQDVDEIKRRFSSQLEYITPRANWWQVSVKFSEKSNAYQVRGVSPAHLFAEKSIIMKGRYINEDDVKDTKKYTVIGRLVEEDLFGSKNALGKYLEINGSVFMVIGVFQDSGGDSEERMIYVPYSTKQLLEKNTDKINEIILAFKPEMGFFGALQFEQQLMAMLKERHSISPEDQSGVYIRNVANDLQKNQQFAGVLQIIVTFVGMGTLVAGIIGISNIMVFVIKERTKELGIRKALGATPRDIIAMILQESIFITLTAGYVGLLCGILILNSVGVHLEHYFIKNPYITTGTGVFATAILVLFGAAAGYIPARRAARIKPIVALRDD
jgi:putative ABC transport system permease protein